jgi:hypothetical protein
MVSGSGASWRLTMYSSERAAVAGSVQHDARARRRAPVDDDDLYMRDHAAVTLMAALIARIPPGHHGPNVLAKNAFDLADAFMIERARRTPLSAQWTDSGAPKNSSTTSSVFKKPEP